MRIDTVQHTIPSRRIDTDWILEKLRRSNAGRFSAVELDSMDQRVRAFLASAGSDIKYQVGDNDRAIEMIAEVSHRALDVSGVGAGDIDLMLYTGVGRAWLEPAMVNAIQSEVGLVSATGFDVLDGCAGWVRALELVDAYFATGRYRKALVVNAELAFENSGRWEFDSLAEMEAYLATYTVGEAATATVISADEIGRGVTGVDAAEGEARSGDFHFHFANYGDHADLCMIPLDNADQFVPEASRKALGQMERGRFFARSEELLVTTTRRLIETFRSDQNFYGHDYDIGFGHAASEKASAIVCRGLGFPAERYYPTHARYGNTVAASIPLGMSLALEEGRLQRGDRVLIVAGASGISIGFARFVF